MTSKILMSQLGSMNVQDFSAAVDRYAIERAQWDNHMDAVRAGRAEKYPAPDAPDAVVAAVRLDRDAAGVVTATPDYELVDDGPTPEQLFPARKDLLFAEVLAVEQRAISMILPPGKQRLWEILVAEAMATRSPQEQQALDEIAGKSDRTETDEAYATAIERKPTRSAEQAKTLDEYEKRSTQIKIVQRWAAERLAEIEDLTVDNIAGFLVGAPPVE